MALIIKIIPFLMLLGILTHLLSNNLTRLGSLQKVFYNERFYFMAYRKKTRSSSRRKSSVSRRSRSSSRSSSKSRSGKRSSSRVSKQTLRIVESASTARQNPFTVSTVKSKTL